MHRYLLVNAIRHHMTINNIIGVPRARKQQINAAGKIMSITIGFLLTCNFWVTNVLKFPKTLICTLLGSYGVTIYNFRRV